MSEEKSGYLIIEQKIISWAEASIDIQGIFVVGSRGKRINIQEGADLDILVLTKKPEKYRFGKLDWCRGIEKIILGQFQPTAHMIFNDSSDYYIVFDKYLDVDFSFVSLNVFQRELFFADWFINFPRIFPRALELSSRKKAEAFHPEFRVLIDKGNIQQKIQSTLGKIIWKFELPLPNQFISEIDEFLIYAFKAAKKVQSGKLFHSKWMVDTTLKYQLVRMAEWHLHSLNRMMEPMRLRDLAIDEWADTRIRNDLARINPTYEIQSVRKSLMAMVDLYYWVSAETATNFGYSDVLLPAIDRFEYIKHYIQSIITEGKL
jgi:hypothetical protein